MNTPLFTIGIPTFNRAKFLKESLQAALSQTYENLQIVVSDNASTDETEEVVNSFADSRIKYSRNPENLGALANFSKTVDLADGMYFSWLQDDDLIFVDFVARAVNLLEEYDLPLYLGTAIKSPTLRSLNLPALYCPPIPMNWQAKIPTVVEAETIAALSLFVSVAIPPVVAFSLQRLRDHVLTIRGSDFPLFAERTILIEAAGKTGAICDPVISGFFRLHPGQTCQNWLAQEGRYEKEWALMAKKIAQLSPSISLSQDSQFSSVATELPSSTLVDWCIEARKWPADITICSQVRSVIERVASDRSKESSMERLCSKSKSSLIHRLADACIPQIVFRQLVKHFGSHAS